MEKIYTQVKGNEYDGTYTKIKIILTSNWSKPSTTCECR